jgi:hypothetical protein
MATLGLIPEIKASVSIAAMTIVAKVRQCLRQEGTRLPYMSSVVRLCPDARPGMELSDMTRAALRLSRLAVRPDDSVDDSVSVTVSSCFRVNRPISDILIYWFTWFSAAKSLSGS